MDDDSVPLVPKLARPLSARSAWDRRSSQDKVAPRPWSREKVVTFTAEHERPQTESAARRPAITQVPGCRNAWDLATDVAPSKQLPVWSKRNLAGMLEKQAKGPASLLREATADATGSGISHHPSGDRAQDTDLAGDAIWATPVFHDRRSAGSTLDSTRGSKHGPLLEPSFAPPSPRHLPGCVHQNSAENLLGLPQGDNWDENAIASASEMEARWESLGHRTGGTGLWLQLPDDPQGLDGIPVSGRESVASVWHTMGAGTQALPTSRSDPILSEGLDGADTVMPPVVTETEDDLRPHCRPKASRGRRPASAGSNAASFRSGKARVHPCPETSGLGMPPSDDTGVGMLESFLRTTGIEDWLRSAAEFVDVPDSPCEASGHGKGRRWGGGTEEVPDALSLAAESLHDQERLAVAMQAITREQYKSRLLYRGGLVVVVLSLLLLVATCGMTYYIVEVGREVHVSDRHALASAGDAPVKAKLAEFTVVRNTLVAAACDTTALGACSAVQLQMTRRSTPLSSLLPDSALRGLRAVALSDGGERMVFAEVAGWGRFEAAGSRFGNVVTLFTPHGDLSLDGDALSVPRGGGAALLRAGFDVDDAGGVWGVATVVGEFEGAPAEPDAAAAEEPQPLRRGAASAPERWREDAGLAAHA